MNQDKKLTVELYPSSKRQFKKLTNECAIENEIEAIHPYALSVLNPDVVDKLQELKGKPILLECQGLSTIFFVDKNTAYKVLDVKVMTLEEEAVGLWMKFPIKTYELRTKDYEWVEDGFETKEPGARILDAQYYWELAGFKFVACVQEE